MDWRFGNMDKLKPVEYKNLSSGMQEFLEAQMSVLTVTGEALPTGIELYKYDGDGLLAFPVNVTLGAAEPIEAQNSLVILVNTPSETAKNRHMFATIDLKRQYIVCRCKKYRQHLKKAN